MRKMAISKYLVHGVGMAVLCVAATGDAAAPSHNRAAVNLPSRDDVVVFKGIVWLGIRTSKFVESVRFYEKTLGLKPTESTGDFRAYDLPNGDRIELFSERESDHRHFTTGPVAGYLVENVARARVILERRGVEFVGPIHGGSASEWSHFKGPDGNLYEITSRRGK